VTYSHIRILLVDDSNTTRKILRKTLTEMGVLFVDEAADGLQAWAMLEAGAASYGMVFCDWHMPGLDGLQLLEKIREHESMRALPFVMTTAERKRTEVERAVLAGATWYIVKPFEAEAIRNVLAKAVLAAAAS